jgi:Plavaka transposase
MQAIWNLLLDDDFVHAYEHGIVIECGDGVTRRVYPCFFTYSADYPEKYHFQTFF